VFHIILKEVGEMYGIEVIYISVVFPIGQTGQIPRDPGAVQLIGRINWTCFSWIETQ